MNHQPFHPARRKLLIMFCLSVVLVASVLIVLVTGVLNVVQFAGIGLGVFVLSVFLLNEAFKGLCPKCGYDLRATPGRCLECGWDKSVPNWKRKQDA